LRHYATLVMVPPLSTFALTHMDTNKLLARYSNGYHLLSNQLSEIPEKAIYYKPDQVSWNIAEVVVHLADAEARGFVRAKKIIAECGGNVCIYNHQIWADRLFYSEVSYKDALHLIRLLRKNIASVLRKIEPGVWHNHIYHPESGKITLLDWILLHNDHIDIHIEQIRRIFCQWKSKHAKEFV
jgi:hypothetical protein